MVKNLDLIGKGGLVLVLLVYHTLNWTLLPTLEEDVLHWFYLQLGTWVLFVVVARLNHVVEVDGMLVGDVFFRV